jgi:transcriptional regulator of acetoin/glycerol metabolism
MLHRSPVQKAYELPLEVAERQALLKTLEECHWQMTRSAKQLGISRNTLYRKIRKYKIKRLCAITT